MAICQENTASKGLDNLLDGPGGQTATGLAVLIGNNYRGTPRELNGPSRDIARARQVFSGLGAACLLVENRPAGYTSDVIKAVTARDYPPSYKFIAVVFSGHGEYKDVLIANDGKPFRLNLDLFQPSSAPQIAKIPKLIFIDACRGNQQSLPVCVPSRTDVLIPRGGEPVDSELFPPMCNMLIAHSTQSTQQAYETPESGGRWINVVLNHIETVDDSITTILDNVRQEMLELAQRDHPYSMQVAPVKSELIGSFNFKRISSNPVIGDKPTKLSSGPSTPNEMPLVQQMSLRQKENTQESTPPSGGSVQGGSQQCTAVLNQMVKDKKLISRQYSNLPEEGNHVKLTVTMATGVQQYFCSNDNGGLSYATKNDAQEKVAQDAVYFINNGQRRNQGQLRGGGAATSNGSVPAVKNKEWAKTLNETLKDKEGQIVSKDDYCVEEIGSKFKCTFKHRYFSKPIEGELKKTKQDAKQSAAEKALIEYYKNKRTS